MKPIVYYSQNREDLILAAFFSDVEKGFYVDVGAHHPTQDSVTKFFYERGWSGINIEPQNELVNKLRASRKRDVNLQMGIADKKGKLTLRSYDSSGMSTFSTEMQKSNEGELGAYEDYEVDVDTLKNVLDENSVTKIHFLKVDVEGFEYEVLKSNDWDQYRPEVICIEVNHIVTDWHKLLKKADYTSVFFDGLNEYFVAKEAYFRYESFKQEFPAMLVSAPRLSHDWKKHLDKTIRQLDKVQKNLDHHMQLTKDLQQQNRSLAEKLQEFDSIKVLLKALFFKVRSKIKNLLTR